MAARNTQEDLAIGSTVSGEMLRHGSNSRSGDRLTVWVAAGFKLYINNALRQPCLSLVTHSSRTMIKAVWNIPEHE